MVKYTIPKIPEQGQTKLNFKSKPTASTQREPLSDMPPNEPQSQHQANYRKRKIIVISSDDEEPESTTQQENVIHQPASVQHIADIVQQQKASDTHSKPFHSAFGVLPREPKLESEVPEEDLVDCDTSRQRTGWVLRQLWVKPPVKLARGAPIKSGQAQIKDKAAVIMAKSTIEPNPVAEALGLGPCRTVPIEDKKRTNKRPFEKLTADVGEGHKGYNVTSYHITWTAKYGPPPDADGMEYSHRCHNRLCVEAMHGIWESGERNKAREKCSKGKSHLLFDNGPEGRHLLAFCNHNKECLSGAVVLNWDHPKIRVV